MTFVLWSPDFLSSATLRLPFISEIFKEPYGRLAEQFCIDIHVSQTTYPDRPEFSFCTDWKLIFVVLIEISQQLLNGPS